MRQATIRAIYPWDSTDAFIPERLTNSKNVRGRDKRSIKIRNISCNECKKLFAKEDIGEGQICVWCTWDMQQILIECLVRLSLLGYLGSCHEYR